MSGCFLCNGPADWAPLGAERVMVTCHGACHREYVLDRPSARALRAGQGLRQRASRGLAGTRASPTDVFELVLGHSGARVSRVDHAADMQACRARFGRVGRSRWLRAARTAWTQLRFRAALGAPFAEQRLRRAAQASSSNDIWLNGELGGVALFAGAPLRREGT